MGRDCVAQTPTLTSHERRVALDKSEGVVKGIVVLAGAEHRVSLPERLRTKTLEISL